jgi:inosine-uridine nucleoside N-ribohydrolase/formylmethanofuran dehydrogenase subunit E
MRAVKRITLILALLVIAGNGFSHPWKPNHYVIIDTDGGFDDFRAITMMLASPEVRVMGITASNGVLDAHDTYFKVKCLLKDTYHEGIPVGLNNDDEAISKNCRPAMEFQWGGNYNFSDSLISAVDLISDLLSKSNDKVELICLGSLNTAANLLKSISFNRDKLKKILWTSNYEILRENFNYRTDKAAFEFIRDNKTPIEVITGTIDNYTYDADFTEGLKSISSIYSDKISGSFSATDKSPFMTMNFDETAALYLHYPRLFNSDTIGTIIRYEVDSIIKQERIQHSYIQIISGQTISQNQVFQTFPSDTSYYFKDVQRIMAESIKKFGKDEWSSCVITNELHRHLGVYAIIGAKMGIRAREYFGIGADEMKIISFAGITPPYSCMNDGLQVSTGGTLGHGLITVSADIIREPKATFTYQGKSISLNLKDEYRKKLESEIREISSIYSLDSSVYWELVRIAALNYWAEWDRHEIFDIVIE